MKKSIKKILTKKLSQSEIVTLAVYLLGGTGHSVDTEDVAIKAHKLAPGRFSWSKYPDQINLEIVRVYLSDAKKPAKGTLLSGSGRTGWMLTQEGLEWAKAAADQVTGLKLGRGREDSRSGSVDENRWRRERARIVNTAAWARWSEGERTIAKDEACEIFRIDSYAVGRLRETKITRLLDLFGEDEQVAPFLADAVKCLSSEGETE